MVAAWPAPWVIFCNDGFVAATPRGALATIGSLHIQSGCEACVCLASTGISWKEDREIVLEAVDLVSSSLQYEIEGLRLGREMCSGP